MAGRTRGNRRGLPFFDRVALWFGLRGRGRSLNELARRLGVPPDEVRKTPVEYRSWPIRKTSGRLRWVREPNPQLKAMQRRIVRRVLGRLRAHPAAHGFERGRSIVTNAAPHAGKRIVCTLDLRGFFDSTWADEVYRYFRRIGWDRAASWQLVRLCTFEGALPQGAPTSPRLANLVNYVMDVCLERLARRYGGDYTRYADDMTFSFSDDVDMECVLDGVFGVVSWCGYAIQRRKGIRIRRRGQRQTVTGLVVNDGVRLPRATRRWLRAVEHRMRLERDTGAGQGGEPRPTLTEAQLQGWRSLCTMVARGAAN